MSELLVRAARRSDMAALNALYNHYVESSAVSFDVEPVSLAAREAWFEQFAERGRHRLLVAESDGELLGYACSHRFHVRPAYDPSVETTIYTAAHRARRGIGTRLYRALFQALEGEDLHRAYAGVTLPNDASVTLHERFGFRPVGTFEEVGCKFGRWWSVRWFEKPLP